MACVFVIRYCVISSYIGSGYPFVLWGSWVSFLHTTGMTHLRIYTARPFSFYQQ